MEEQLIQQGYKKQHFFFQTGGGEYEDAVYLFVKGKVVFFQRNKKWYSFDLDDINHIEGLPDQPIHYEFKSISKA